MLVTGCRDWKVHGYSPENSVPIIGVGASAGGLEALRDLLSGEDDLSDVAIVVVQHLDPTRESMMAQLLERHTTMAVRRITGGERVAAGTVYVIPPGRGLEIEDGVLRLLRFDAPRGLRRPIDDFFESLARDRGPRTAGVVLSGTGADGSRGLRAIKECGGIAIAQAPEDARHDGMPRAAVGTGLVDFVEPAQMILPKLVDYFRREPGAALPSVETETVAAQVSALCDVLAQATGHDFSGYKRSTLTRRIERRMQVLGLADAADYLAVLRREERERQALFRDLLINVTRFFRDAEVFEALRERSVFPMIRDAREDEEIRVWVPGCSSGEEAYSIAMLFREAMEHYGRYPLVNIFASDIDERMLETAREGTYPTAALADIPEGLRGRFTQAGGDHRFRISPEVRDMVRFSLHSVIKDPPFSRVDLISCRNLLIYFDEPLQRAVLPLFHYALRPEGHLLLGLSETVGRFDDLFEDLDPRGRLFRRRAVRPSYPLDLPFSTRERVPSSPATTPGGEEADRLERRAADQLARRHAPPSLLVDETGGILASWGRIGAYFDFPHDTTTRPRNAATLAKGGLRDVLGPLIRQTAEDRRPHVVRGVEVQGDFGIQEVRVSCEPVRDGAMLVVLRDTAAFRPLGEDEEGMIELASGTDQMQVLENELHATRHRLRAAVEDLEAANEELKSSNEEMMSMNEELQSTNEELTAVNDELKTKVDQLTVANADLKNFFASTELAVVVVDAALCIRSFTEATANLFAFTPSDHGRPLAEVDSPLRAPAYLEAARQVIETGETVEDRLHDAAQGRDFVLRVIPYSRLDGVLDGAIFVLTEVTDVLALERDLVAERARLELAVEVAEIGVWEYNLRTGDMQFNDAAQHFFGLRDGAGGDRLMASIHGEDRRRVWRALRQVSRGRALYNETFRVTLSDGSLRWVRGLGRFIERDGLRTVVGVSYDVTSEYRLIEERELHLREMNHRIKNLFAVVSAMISTSEREASTMKAFSENLRGRVAALDRAHALMLHGDVRSPIALGEILTSLLQPARGRQEVRLEGPEILIPVAQLTSLVLILHEWVTNAAKYGALSWEGGKLDVVWRCAGETLRLDWTELTPREVGFETRGFGSRLIQASAMQLGADLDRRAEGRTMRLSLTMPAFED
ncbi:CheR family methyltransferase [Celeribacter indicus]|uniref:CheR family methyltransferase n=1 Tax=Celeribacter indicus TaxID=1208324 RepID=UPI003F5D3ADF